MADFYVLPAHVFEDAQVVAAVGERNAAKKAAERDSILAGQVVIIPADQVTRRTIASTTTVDAT